MKYSSFARQYCDSPNFQCNPIHIILAYPKTNSNLFQAIKDKNFDLFAEITMKESNQLHAVCLDSYPPAVYMNDTSHAISAFVHEYNNMAKGQKVSSFFSVNL